MPNPNVVKIDEARRRAATDDLIDNKLRSGIVNIDIVGQLVCEELFRYRLEKYVRGILINGESVGDSDYDLYGKALKILK